MVISVGVVMIFFIPMVLAMIFLILFKLFIVLARLITIDDKLK